ncbi:hypothetical protein ACFQX6_15040 [Streptosporangium lutulentum]
MSLHESAVPLRGQFGHYLLAQVKKIVGPHRYRVKRPGNSVDWKISSAQIIWVQVVPHFEGAEITMSPSRNAMSSQRVLSIRMFW